VRTQLPEAIQEQVAKLMEKNATSKKETASVWTETIGRTLEQAMRDIRQVDVRPFLFYCPHRHSPPHSIDSMPEPSICSEGIFLESREHLAKLLQFETWEDARPHPRSDVQSLKNAILRLDNAIVNDDEWYDITSNTSAAKYIIESKSRNRIPTGVVGGILISL